MKVHPTKSQSFWRGFGSAFDLFPRSVRAGRRERFNKESSASFVLNRAWEQVGSSLNSALGNYGQEATKERRCPGASAK